MRAALGFALSALKETLRRKRLAAAATPLLKPPHHHHHIMSPRPHQLCFSRFQENGSCNGTQSSKKTLLSLSDPQLFEAQFDELVTELTERDIADPALTDALNRLREVCFSCRTLCFH